MNDDPDLVVPYILKHSSGHLMYRWTNSRRGQLRSRQHESPVLSAAQLWARMRTRDVCGETRDSYRP